MVKRRLYGAYIRSSMLHGCELWYVTAEDMHWLEWSAGSMIRWMCKFHTRDLQGVSSLKGKTCIRGIGRRVQERHLRWFGHVMCMDDDICEKKSQSLTVVNIIKIMQCCESFAQGHSQWDWNMDHKIGKRIFYHAATLVHVGHFSPEAFEQYFIIRTMWIISHQYYPTAINIEFRRQPMLEP